jgi:pullulanase
MKYQFKPIMLGSAIAVSLALSGCGNEQAQPEITDIFAEVGLWCKNPEIVQISSADFYPLTADEQAGLDASKAEAKTAAEIEAGDSWDESAWEADFKYEQLDLYSILGLTLEETERQVIAKEEARTFQISQGQDVIRGEGFNEWFEFWFAEVPPASYLGPSQRINRSVNATTADMDGDEICYTPPLSCPNYKVIDEAGVYECIIPEQNPILDAPAPVVTAGPNEAVVFYRNEGHVDGGDNAALYENMIVHTWNDDAEVCTAYADDSIASWGANSTYANDNSGIDPNYGIYWKLHLVDEPGNCGNVIFNDTALGKQVSDSDLMMPIGPSGNVVLHNLDKNAYADDNFSVNVLDGMLLVNQHPYFGAEASSGITSCGWSQAANDSGICVGEALECPVDTVAVGVGAEEIASKCVVAFNPDETALLLRGGFNGWGDAADPGFDASQLTYVNNGQYRANFPHTSDCVIVEPVEATDTTEAVEGEDCVSSYDFKVADIDWSEPSTFGSIKGGDQSAVGSTITMTVGEGVGQNMKVDMAKDKIYQFLVNASDVTAVALTINEVPVDAYPMLTIGSETVDLSYTANGQYVARLDLAAETHSFTIADPSTSFAVGAIGTENVVVASTPLALENGGGALSFTSTAAEYDFVLDMSDPAAPMIEIKPALPFGSTPVFIRGSVNSWSSPDTDELKWNADKQSYSVIYGLEADGNHAFKFADASWGTVNLGFNDVTISDDADAIAVTDDGGNMRVSVAKSTSYLFEVIFDSADPVVKVSEAPLYLRGSITDWGASDVNQLMFATSDAGKSDETSHTYSIEVVISGPGEFKVADEGWGGSFGYNYGVEVADTKVELGVALALVQSNNNIKIDLPAGTYIFAFEDGVSKTMTVTAK